MFDYINTNTENRTLSAPEVALRSREYGKEQALLLASYQAQIASANHSRRPSRGLLSRLMSSLGLF